MAASSELPAAGAWLARDRLGVPLLLGVSRKGLIRDIGQAPNARDRMPGSVAVALAGVAQGAQILRIHDVAETRQALRLWLAIEEGL